MNALVFIVMLLMPDNTVTTATRQVPVCPPHEIATIFGEQAKQAAGAVDYAIGCLAVNFTDVKSAPEA